jgi:hypothetical protein
MDLQAYGAEPLYFPHFAPRVASRKDAANPSASYFQPAAIHLREK